MLERLGYPDGRWRRPALWTALVVLSCLFIAWVGPEATFGGRLVLLGGLINLVRYTDRSWRKHRTDLLVPLGHVEWPRR